MLKIKKLDPKADAVRRFHKLEFKADMKAFRTFYKKAEIMEQINRRPEKYISKELRETDAQFGRMVSEKTGQEAYRLYDKYANDAPTGKPLSHYLVWTSFGSSVAMLLGTAFRILGAGPHPILPMQEYKQQMENVLATLGVATIASWIASRLTGNVHSPTTKAWKKIEAMVAKEKEASPAPESGQMAPAR